MPIVISLDSLDEARALFGLNDRNLAQLREQFEVGIYNRKGTVRIESLRGGDEPVEDDSSDPGVVRTAAVIRTLLDDIRAGRPIGPESVERLLEPRAGITKRPKGLTGRLGVKPASDGQARYIEKMESHDLTFCIGPAGTGKTFLAVAAAVRGLKDGLVERIVLCRPAVEAGEHLGFLPGDLHAKISPYLRPLYDALYGVLDYDTVKRYQEREVIEVAPLAYMRGRTLRRSFIILDEGQNTTQSQMKMFLTRMGEDSRIVVTGDISQMDLPKDTGSGLVHARRILEGIDGIAFQVMTGRDIVRHNLVRKIIDAYEGRAKRGDTPRDRR